MYINIYICVYPSVLRYVCTCVPCLGLCPCLVLVILLAYIFVFLRTDFPSLVLHPSPHPMYSSVLMSATTSSPGAAADPTLRASTPESPVARSQSLDSGSAQDGGHEQDHRAQETTHSSPDSVDLSTLDKFEVFNERPLCMGALDVEFANEQTEGDELCPLSPTPIVFPLLVCIDLPTTILCGFVGPNTHTQKKAFVYVHL